VGKEDFMRVLRCRDVGFDCEGEVRGQSDDEVLSQAAEHALATHNVTVTPEMAESIRAKIKEEPATA
jgi:predicted small metal-binding protein